MIQLYALVSTLLLWNASAVAQGQAASADQMAYLAAALDRWSVDLPIVVTMLEEPSPPVRARAVQVLGSTADASFIPLLESYMADSKAAVRREVMLATGRLGPEGLDLAIRGLGDGSPIVRQAAAWAACHAGDAAWPAISRILTTEKDQAVLETALANMWRLENAQWLPTASRFADHASPYLRRATAYSLSRTGDPVARAAQRKLAGDEEPVIRATILRGFARGELMGDDLQIVVGALDDPDWRVQAAACGVLPAQGSTKLPEKARRKVASFFSSTHPQLAWMALAAALTQPNVGTTTELVAVINGTEPWLATQSLAALAARDAAAAGKIATAWGKQSSQGWRRRAAAGAAANIGPEAEARAQADPDAGVRLAWLSSLDAEQTAERSERLRSLLSEDPDPAVRAQIVSLLRDAGAAPSVEELIALHTAWRHDTMPDARTEALVAAMAASDSGPKRQAILNIGLEDSDPAAVAMAVNGARGLGESVAFPRREARHGALWYQELLIWATQPRWLDVVTDRGTFRIQLDLNAAPLSSREIWDLAANGFYDGLDFHRVVPNFVVQGGDPRGDGWGGPDFVLPDEPSLVPFDSWRVGIATSGPQTGGCQLFITLTPADHLTGHYTNIGEVVAGRDVLTRIRVGDRIREVRPLSGQVDPLATAPPNTSESTL